MSGPDWTNDERGTRDGSEPLTTPGTDPEPATRRVPAPSPPLVSDPESAMTHAPSDHDEPDSDGTDGPRKSSGWLQGLLAILRKIPLPARFAGNSKASAEPVAHEQAPDPSPTPAPTPKRAARRIPFLPTKPEGRIGLAALLTFVVFVGALASRKGWFGSPIPLAIKHNSRPGDDPKKGEPAKPAVDPEKPKESPDSPPVPTPAPISTPAPTPGPDPSTPSPGATPKAELPGERPPPEPATLPRAEGEPSKPILPGDLPLSTPMDVTPTPPVTPPPPPDSGPNKLPDIPKEAKDPLPLPVDPAPTPPTAVPAPSTTPAVDPFPIPETKPSPPEPKPVEPPIFVAPPVVTPPVVAPPVAPTPQPMPVEPKPEASPLVPSVKAPPLDPVPAAEASTATAAASTLGAGWVIIKSGGKRGPGTGTIVSTPADAPSDAPSDPPRVVDGPRVRDDVEAPDQVQPALHKVQPGENFWTISKTFYGSGDYYQALWAANRRQVPKIDELYVGTVLRVPPIEALDRSKVVRSKTNDPNASTTSQTTARKADLARKVELAAPVRPRPSRVEADLDDQPRRPTYTVKAHETLRSIARDTLDDPKRDREIFSLNRDLLGDSNDLTPGTTLTLPADAIIGRRVR